MIGDIAYFQDFAYDLLVENDRMRAAKFDAVIAARRTSRLERIVVSSSWISFGTTHFRLRS